MLFKWLYYILVPDFVVKTSSTSSDKTKKNKKTDPVTAKATTEPKTGKLYWTRNRSDLVKDFQIISDVNRDISEFLGIPATTAH